MKRLRLANGSRELAYVRSNGLIELLTVDNATSTEHTPVFSASKDDGEKPWLSTMLWVVGPKAWPKRQRRRKLNPQPQRLSQNLNRNNKLLSLHQFQHLQ